MKINNEGNYVMENFNWGVILKIYIWINLIIIYYFRNNIILIISIQW